MSDTQGPAVKPFSYVHVPAEDSATVSPIDFDGTSDDELRERLRRFFAKGSYTDGARTEMRATLLQKIEKDAKTTVSDDMLARLTDDEGAFEIVPVVMPSRANGFRAMSLYIDDKGRFKDLPLNSRASKLAQRDIRGDAFLLSNHDDPALDTWERVDTTVKQFEELYANPPKTQVDTSNQAQMMAAAAGRDSDTLVVSDEAASEGLALREQGNEAVRAADFTQAAALYAAASEKLRGRTDLLPNEADIKKARIACHLNLAHCAIKLTQWQMATNAAGAALREDPENPKGWFRLATAHVQLREFDEADSAIGRCAAHGVPEQDVTTLRAASAQGRAALRSEEKKRYAGMFS